MPASEFHIGLRHPRQRFQARQHGRQNRASAESRHWAASAETGRVKHSSTGPTYCCSCHDASIPFSRNHQPLKTLWHPESHRPLDTMALRQHPLYPCLNATGLYTDKGLPEVSPAQPGPAWRRHRAAVPGIGCPVYGGVEHAAFGRQS